MTKLYLAGPMSNIPSFNFPAFFAAAKALRERGYEVVNPAEEDYKHGIGEQAAASPDGDPSKLSESWGTTLARDVKMISDEVDGIVFLKGWQQSRGAKLEAFVGLLQKDFQFFAYAPDIDEEDPMIELDPEGVLDEIYDEMIEKIIYTKVDALCDALEET